MRIKILKNIVLVCGGILVGCVLFLGFVFPEVNCHQKPIFHYITNKSVEVTINLVSSEENVPVYYTARLQSPVCMEDLCNPIDIVIEWDLLGDFKTYTEIPGDPITKFDHEPLTEADHVKLKKILANGESLLQDYRMEDLVDTTELIYSEEIDGMTGATSKTFENDIVPGAVYTCYTLWQFVNGDLQSKLLEYSKSIMDEDLIVAMIHSRKKNYLNYILESNPGNFSPKVNQAVGMLIWNSDPIISVKAISAVKDDFWVKDSIRDLVNDKFFKLENPVQNAVIRHFENTQTSKDYVSVFLHLLPDLKENQRNQVYEIFKFNANKLDEEMKRELNSIFKSSGYRMTAKEYELLSKLVIDY